MERYSIIVEATAKKELALIYKVGNKSEIKRIERIFKELEIHPTEGIGNPEQLKHELTGFWSRRINKKDRIIYQIKENSILILSAKGHYEK